MLNSKPIGNKIAETEENENLSTSQFVWTGMVPIDDTALAATDTGGSGIPIIYLNGQFATQGYWKKVIDDIGSEFRHITYDERARGNKSKIKISAKVSSNHDLILKKDFRAVANAVREIASINKQMTTK